MFVVSCFQNRIFVLLITTKERYKEVRQGL